MNSTQSFEPVLSDFKGIGFDLDNTLYDELQYYENSLPELYDKFFKRNSISFDSLSEVYFSILQKQGKHYGFLFNDILKEFNIFSQNNLEEILYLFKNISCELTLYDCVAEILNSLKQSHTLVLMTGGMKEVQMNKIALLDIKKCFNHVIYSSTLSQNKPHITAFEYMVNCMGTEVFHSCYVGDNPFTDFEGANKLGIYTFQVHNIDFHLTDYQYPFCGKSIGSHIKDFI